jgi:hypothetical protein
MRQPELEARHDPAGPHDSRQLGECRGRIRHVADQVGERERVEGAVGERELLSAAFDERDPVGEPGRFDPRARPSEHLRALVDSDHTAAVLPDELDRDRGCPGRHVQDRAVWPALDP